MDIFVVLGELDYQNTYVIGTFDSLELAKKSIQKECQRKGIKYEIRKYRDIEFHVILFGHFYDNINVYKSKLNNGDLL
jgi:hypothetical protein